MSYEIRENSGSLFRNEKKEKETHSDYNGKVNINGVEYYINAWTKESREGMKYFSLSFKEIGETAGTGAAKQSASTSKPVKDDMPF